MYAVIKTGGKQYRVNPGADIKVEKLLGDVGDTITFHQVLLTSDGDTIKVGKPFLEDASVTGRIIRHLKHKKVVVFKYKRRKGYRKKAGHRQHLSQVRIEEIAP